MSKQARASECDVCGHMLKKTYKARNEFHADSKCHGLIGDMEERAKQMFGE